MATKAKDVYRLDEVLSPRAKETLKRLELFCRQKVNGLLQGLHRSKRKGVSTEFDHHKLYHPGDPLKHVDWKVSARQDKYYLKRYLEDTAMQVRIVVDRSASMRQAHEGMTKYRAAAQAVAGLAYLIIRQRDAVSLILANSSRNVWLPPSSADSHLVGILRALASEEAHDQDNLGDCLSTMVDTGGRKGLVVLVSDMMFDPEPIQEQLGRLAAQGQDLIVVQVRDPMEEEFPFTRWVRFGDLEDPSVRILLDAVPLRKIYVEEYKALQEEWKTWANKHGAHMISYRTDEKVEAILSDYMAYRSGMG